MSGGAPDGARDVGAWTLTAPGIHGERVPMRDRVFQFVADGVDLIVSTDHNVIADYAPVIGELGELVIRSPMPLKRSHSSPKPIASACVRSWKSSSS